MKKPTEKKINAKHPVTWIPLQLDFHMKNPTQIHGLQYPFNLTPQPVAVANKGL